MDTTRFCENFTHLNPGLAPYVHDLSWSLVKAHKVRLRLQFLQNCMKEQVLPKSVLPQRLVKMSDPMAKKKETSIWHPEHTKSSNAPDGKAIHPPSEDVEGKEVDFTFEEFWSLAGTRGLWNYATMILLQIGSIPSALYVLSYQFLGATPDYWCHIQELHDANWTSQQIIDFAIPRRADGKLEGCLQRDYNYTLATSLGYETAKENLDLITNVVNGTMSCLKRDFNHTQYKSTLVTDFDLVCERRALYSTTSSITQMGILAASFIVGYATDLFGKRRFILVCYLMLYSLALLTAASPTVEMYLACQFFLSIFRYASSVTEFVLILEVSSNSLRSYIGSVGSIPWSLGQILIPAFAYYIREWKYLQLAYIVPYLYCITYYWTLPESPRWLILRGRYSEVIKFLKKIARWNKRQLPSDEKLMKMLKCINLKEEENQHAQIDISKNLVTRAFDQLKELFSSKTRARRTIVMFLCWYTTAFVYYGISLISINIGSNEYWYMFFGGLVEIAACILLWPMIHYWGRRLSLVLCFFMCAASILGTLAVGDSTVWKTTLSLAGKFAISNCFCLVYLMAAEINTTKGRTLAVGFSSVVARFGSISSPYVNDLLGVTNPTAPPTMFGVLSCVMALLAFTLPETRKSILPESHNDVKNIGSSTRNKETKDCVGANENEGVSHDAA
ncbi:organic cation transporter protein-like [Oratosquilla oratoria]|uniref:organic cation transporter protein-like n=1 Tax=Oratosquilla oratoria TaxID=337810 RepID=UPI003F762479